MQTKIAKSHESSREGRERIPAATGSLRKQRLDTETIIIPAYTPRIMRRWRTKATPSRPVSLYSWKKLKQLPLKGTFLSLKMMMHAGPAAQRFNRACSHSFPPTFNRTHLMIQSPTLSPRIDYYASTCSSSGANTIILLSPNEPEPPQS